jgi:hypothetical protein
MSAVAGRASVGAHEAEWVEIAGRHVALAITAIPEHALRAWLCDEQTIGGTEVLQTLRTGAAARAGVAQEQAAVRKERVA